MKKNVLTFAMCFLLLQGYSQNSLLKLIKSEGGISKQYTEIPQHLQPVFTARGLSAALGLPNKASLVLYSTETDNLGFTHYRFEQTYAGIPIENSMFIAHVKNGKVVSVSGTIVTDFNAAIDQRLAAKSILDKDAIKKAIQFVNAKAYAWEDPAMEALIKEQSKNTKASYFPTISKVWYNDGAGINPSALRLVYKVDVYATDPDSRAYYYIDAETGKVMGKNDIMMMSDVTGTANTLYSGTQTIHSDKVSATSYRLRDFTRGLGVITLQAKNKADFTSTTANWNLALPEQNGLDAHWGVEMTYDFYKVNFNRNSVDNKGLALYSYVNKGGFLYIDNASWDGTAMNYGKRSGSSKGVTGIDVTGHELTHGVTQYTSKLVYNGESGAINESMSDIMGKSVQFWAKPNDINWQLSNDMGWIIRDFSNPNAEKQPDTYKGTYWYTGSNTSTLVHTNSGIGNFMFYLLVNGGSGTNDIGNKYSVTSIGLSKADQIIYRTETTYLTPNATYADWRTACISAATDLYGAASNEVKQVKNAWYAVGVGAATASVTDTNGKQQNGSVIVSPNPLTGGVTSVVTYVLEKAGSVIISIFGKDGKTLQSFPVGHQSEGKQTYYMHNINLKTGDYYLNVEQDGVIIGQAKVLSMP